MDGKAPETCWATHERQVINLWNSCIFLVDLFESYDDAWTNERQIYKWILVLCSFLKVYQVSHPYETMAKTIALYIWMFMPYMGDGTTGDSKLIDS